jgi:hypothetical protein
MIKMIKAIKAIKISVTSPGRIIAARLGDFAHLGRLQFDFSLNDLRHSVATDIDLQKSNNCTIIF